MPAQLLCHPAFSGAKNQYSQDLEEKYKRYLLNLKHSCKACGDMELGFMAAVSGEI